MSIASVTAESLVHDLHNFYGVRADRLQSEEYLQQDPHPTPGGFLQWLNARSNRRR